MIEVNNVTKMYGNYPAITDVSFRVEAGEILGFLGPNGAGKTTTMKIVTGFIPPTSGEVTIAGYDIVTESLEARRHIGYLPETVPLYTEMNIKEYLTFMGKLRGMSGGRIASRTDDVVGVCHLEDYYTTIIGKLSKGFRQRVGIAQAILHEPEVLILDEPTIGIDPIQVVETRQLIKDLGGQQTLILSTHILPEVSQICERVIIIHEGQIIAVDSPENLAERLVGRERVDIEVKGPQQDVIKAMADVDGVQSVDRIPDEPGQVPKYRVQSELGVEIRAGLAAKVVNAGWDLLGLEGVVMSLEEIFLRLTTEEEVVAR
ncbi:MAG: ABC transporter ATP-binding protein [SAR202 cluster bacterium]|jgi:ABC-2 type transport system ATP-binding protein|nr:ABC transporter ATP-binding protein [SAR202 cluster bacterium]MDP6302552.1 ABC transporter ATP-binding protein [SAR202 cluster bacterium]MDP7103811.1 ABC transporter ATP-binding protein [SAR202 cluster bacterium]MDP7225325.1 ABC transporter ATP-binding protein [SAR202 cluster bacterium]MDP7413540.1 ABC transporter ATP-binding protein [SAR202 cluster bacterium]|tara:strand:- start:2580 stop:3530 length:951 start_codon:yes stop_codon:yes gene_type:complete